MRDVVPSRKLGFYEVRHALVWGAAMKRFKTSSGALSLLRTRRPDVHVPASSRWVVEAPWALTR